MAPWFGMVGPLSGFGDRRFWIRAMRAAMSDEATEERTREDESADGSSVPQEGDAGPHAGASHGEPDKSAKKTEEAPAASRAEVSNYEIVEHWFGVAAERLDLDDDVAAVLRSSYREVQVQVPVKLG